MIPLLDLFCGAGGAAMGYHRSGIFDPIIGIDIEPQPHYPFLAIEEDVFSFLENEENIQKFGFIHASPPCQGYSWAGAKHRDPNNVFYIERIRNILQLYEIPYVIENVRTTELQNPIILTGLMFGLNTIRTRYFEVNFPVNQPPIHKIRGSIKDKTNKLVTVAGHGGHGSNHFQDWRLALQISWMNKKELAQAIPPAYTYYLAQEFKKHGNFIQYR